MTPQDLQLLQELELEEKECERNHKLQSWIDQPLASLVLIGDGFSCDFNETTETFTNGKVTITVPKSCVKWSKPPELPSGPTEMTPERQQQLFKLRQAKLGL